MAAPTFVAEYEVASWNTGGNSKTVTPTTADDDLLVLVGGAEGAELTLDPAGNGMTYTLRQSITVTDFCAAFAWTAPATGASGWTLTVTKDGNNLLWGVTALRFSGAGGVGTSAKTNTSGAPSLSITTTQANSAIVVFVSDWNAADGTTRTWRTVNGTTPTIGNGLERTYFRNSSAYAVYAAYYPDAGAVGSKTVGLSAPSGQKYSIVAVEILGTADAETGETAGSAGIALGITATAAKHAGVTAPLTLGLGTADDAEKTGQATGSTALALEATSAAQKQALTASALDLALAIAGTAQAAGEGTTAGDYGLTLGLSATAAKSSAADATMAVALAILGAANAGAGGSTSGTLAVHLAALGAATKRAVAAANLGLGVGVHGAPTAKQATANAVLDLALAVAGLTGEMAIPTGARTLVSLTPARTALSQVPARSLRSTTPSRSLAAMED
jgi:hypothetical protein